MAEGKHDGTEEPPASFSEKGGAWVVWQFVLMVAWLVVPPRGPSVAPSPALRIAAVALFAVGGVAGVAGTLVLGRNRTPFPRPRADSRLVQTGIYAVVRHPLSSSLIALSLAWACWWGSGIGAGLAIVQALLLDAKARREERWLRGQFPEYAEYAAKVRRLIPGIY